MSLTKRKIEYNEEMFGYAKEILFEIGAIKNCICREIFYETYNLDKKDIYAIATIKLKEKFGSQYDYKIFHEQIKLVLSEALSENDCECNSND